MNNKELLIDFIEYAKSRHIMPVLHSNIEPLVDDYLSSRNIGNTHVSGSFINELAKGHIDKCKDACYSSGSFVGRNAGNELEGDYGSWRDWQARLVLFGRELLKNCR